MPTRKKTRKKTAARRGAKKTTVQRIQDELPPELRAYAKRVQQGLSRLEKQIETAQRDARKRFTRLLRDVSHQLGGIEAEGERQWRKRTARARHEAVKLLRRLEQTLETTKKKVKAARPKPRKAAARPKPRRVVARPAPTAAAPKPAVATPPKPAAPVTPKPMVAPPMSIQPKPAAPAGTPGTPGSTLPRSGSGS